MLYLGLNAGVVAGDVAAHAAGINAFRAFLATIILVVPALVGTRLLFVVSHWERYRHDLRRIWGRSEGGAGQYGGFALALLFSVPLLHTLHLPLGAFWDVATITILVTMILGRIGCLMQGCCAGRPTKGWLSMYLPNHMGVWERRIPTQCLEAGWAGVLLISAIAVWRWLPFSGALFLLATAGYGCGRLVMESTREPDEGAARFNMYHGISVAITVLSLAVLAARWPK
jgi:phosphatidylglycerol:prolipoprotein diacylglycerol transferase